MKTFTFICILLTIITIGCCTSDRINYVQECGSYINQINNANDPELALKNINIAIKYLEDNDITHGYTSAIYKTEGDNIEFFYKNLLSCRKNIQDFINKYMNNGNNVIDDSVIGKQYAWQMIKEKYFDELGFKGEPLGISRYPHNTAYMIMWIILIIGWIIMKLNAD